ncbi:MAG: hypothetical protein HGA45_13690 [Chloroflexales bacterium]|nr:hypothetical protein [Chloroflexales bacterium]
MTTPKPSAPPPAAPPQTPPSVSATIIAEVGNGVTRLATVAVPLAVTAADAIAEYLPRLLAPARASLEGLAAPEERGELAAATSELVSAGARLSRGLLTVAVRGLEAVRHAVSTAASDSDAPRTDLPRRIGQDVSPSPEEQYGSRRWM